jgi:transposase
MFIRATKTKNKKTGDVYTKHVLVESVRVNGEPRQRTIMQLGQLKLPKHEWKKLAHALACQISGQLSLLTEIDAEIEKLASSLYSNLQLSQSLAVKSSEEKEQQIVAIDLNSVSTTKTRSLGAEIVAQKAWKDLDFDNILARAGFSERDTALAKAVIFGRLISPGSERHICEWYKKRSALSELPGLDVSGFCNDLFYDIGDELYQNKDAIEQALYNREQKLFPDAGDTIYLYDLTNTYMEGGCLGNDLAQYGHCKSKRFDCPIITLSLVVTGKGLPVASHIYKGNQSEPETMKDMISRLNTLVHGNQEVMIKPTVAMDRGIATSANVAYLNENGYQYIVVKREDEASEYINDFKNGRQTFTQVKDARISAYGEANSVYAKKIDCDDENICKVLCISDGKARKELAIAAGRDKKFLDDIDRLNVSIAKGNIKKPDKIDDKIGRISSKHSSTSKKFDTELVLNDTGKAVSVKATKKPDDNDLVYGCYVIESTHNELSETELWSLYTTLTRVESAFRAMKSELGMRPVFHQTEDRCAAHLFITVLAYHLLITIEKYLQVGGDCRLWSTVRDTLSTHTRSTVRFTGADKTSYHVRVSGSPEDVHSEIYKTLGIRSFLKPVTSIIASQ